MDLLQTKGIETQYLGVKALKGVDFAVTAGEKHAHRGENGAGKSTLIKIITGVYPASAGSVYFNGRSANSVPRWTPNTPASAPCTRK